MNSYTSKPCSCPQCLKMYYNPMEYPTSTNSQHTRLNMIDMHDTKALVDCAYDDYCKCRHPIQQQGSPYNVYNYDGTMRKDLPLTMRPDIGTKFSGAEGYLIPDMNYLQEECPRGMLLMNGRGPCVTMETCQKMNGRACVYGDGWMNKSSCYINPGGKGIMQYTCPLPIRRN